LNIENLRNAIYFIPLNPSSPRGRLHELEAARGGKRNSIYLVIVVNQEKLINIDDKLSIRTTKRLNLLSERAGKSTKDISLLLVQ
jgi:hypothetical protein